MKPTKKRKYLARKPDPRNPEIVRIYFRHPKTEIYTPLPSDETSVEFRQDYDALLSSVVAIPETPKPPRDPNTRLARGRGDGTIVFMPPTLGWFADQYLASKYFNPDHADCYAEGTCYNYTKHLGTLKARLGAGNLVDLDQEAVEVYSAGIAREHGNSAGDDQIAMISNVWEFAKGFGEFKRKGRINPTTRIKRHYKHDGEGHLVWPESVIDVFDADCPPHLQFLRMGLHYSGQRGGDVVKMKWTDFDGKRIHVIQEKTGKKLWLNCPKPFLAALRREQRKSNHEYIFVQPKGGEPYASAQTLSHAIRNRLHSLGFTDYVMHGLRKNAGMELALAGCSVPEIMAVLGHKTPKMALYYVEQAQQETMNENAVVKWDASIEKNAAKKLAGKRAMLRAVG